MELNSGSLVFSANTKDHKTPHVSVECLSQAVPGAAVSPSYLWRWGMLQIRLCLCMAERLSAPGSRCSRDYQWSKCRYEHVWHVSGRATDPHSFLSFVWDSKLACLKKLLWCGCTVRAEPAFSPFLQQVAECRVETRAKYSALQLRRFFVFSSSRGLCCLLTFVLLFGIHSSVDKLWY